MAINNDRFSSTLDTLLNNSDYNKYQAVTAFSNWINWNLLSRSQISEAESKSKKIIKDGETPLQKSYGYLILGIICQYKKDPKALAIYEQSRQSGNPYAAYYIGSLYQDGACGVEKNLETAANIFNANSDANEINPEIFVARATMIQAKKELTGKDLSEMARNYIKAAYYGIGSANAYSLFADYLYNHREQVWTIDDEKISAYELAVKYAQQAFNRKSCYGAATLGALQNEGLKTPAALNAYLHAYIFDGPLEKKAEILNKITEIINENILPDGTDRNDLIPESILPFLQQKIDQEADVDDENKLILLLLRFKDNILKFIDKNKAPFLFESSLNPETRLSKLLSAGRKTSAILGRPVTAMFQTQTMSELKTSQVTQTKINSTRFSAVMESWYLGEYEAIITFSNWVKWNLLNDAQINQFLQRAHNALLSRCSYGDLASGLMYEKSEDPEKARTDYLEAFESGCIYAASYLGNLEQKNPTAKDKALDYYEQGMKKNDPASFRSYAELIQRGECKLEKNIERAIWYYEQAIVLGDVSAMCSLADICQSPEGKNREWKDIDGENTLLSDEKAIELYSKALAKKSAKAGISLGNLQNKAGKPALFIKAYLSAFILDLPLGKKEELYKSIADNLSSLMKTSHATDIITDAILPFLNEEDVDADPEDEDRLILLFLPYKDLIAEQVIAVRDYEIGNGFFKKIFSSDEVTKKPNTRFAKLMSANTISSRLAQKPVSFMPTATLDKLRHLRPGGGDATLERPYRK